MRILLTGATGFIGQALLNELLGKEHEVIAVKRKLATGRAGGDSDFLVADISANNDWLPALQGVEAVIHAAARAHVMNDTVTDPLAEFRKVNVEGTLNLARQAAAAGVKRFIFISSIKVNGEATSPGKPFLVSDVPAPEDAYGLSKLEAERGLLQIAAETGLEVVIIRPPLVYGPGVKGNFASMTRLVEKGLPLPLGAIHNRRSLVGIDNLVALIIRCIDHPAATNQIFLAGDAEDLSTTQLLRGVARAMGRPSRLIAVPAGLLKGGAMLLGKRTLAQRLLGSLQVDIAHTCELLDWKPPFTVDEGLRRCFAKPD